MAKHVEGANVVLTGHEVVGDGTRRKVREFKRLAKIDHEKRRLLVVEGRYFEYVGDDAEGRRIYRDQTRM